MKGMLIILYCFYFVSASTYSDLWTNFPACKMGRLQSPIRLNVTQSVYNSTFSIVYQQFTQHTYEWPSVTNSSPVYQTTNEITGQFINFQKGGMIKQYKLEKIQLYQGLHKVENIISEFELHLIFKKVLGFTTNQNQYQRIQDANNYLALVIRYNRTSSTMSDNGLYNCLISSSSSSSSCNIGQFPIFQDKRAYYYEGSFIYNPCQEDVNYIVLRDVFYSEIRDPYTDESWAKRDFAYSYDRPIYRNFMNYSETISSGYIKLSFVLLFSLFFLLF